jgi:hypothetical protein
MRKPVSKADIISSVDGSITDGTSASASLTTEEMFELGKMLITGYTLRTG